MKTKAGIAIAVASAGTAGAVGTIAVRNAILAHQPVLSERQSPSITTAAIEPTPAKERKTQNSVVFGIEGKDTSGRRGAFDVVVLDKSFLWVRGSADELEKDGKAIASADLAAAVLDAEVRGALADAKQVIAVGTASQEGDAAEEVARAERRAQKAAILVADAVPSTTPIWTLNLGQYREPCENCETAGTSWQRPFIVIAVRELEPSTDLGEALADAMKGKSKLPSPSSYSQFALARIR